MAKDLNKLFNEISKNSKALAMNAMNAAAQKAYDMSVQKAESCLQQYYSNYSPRYYKRTGTLKKAIKLHAPKQVSSGKSHEIRFSIEYDSSMIEGLYASNSWYHQSGDTWRSVEQYNTFSQDNGIPDAGWILENYLYGIHPRYVGTPQTGISNNSVQDRTNTMSEMTRFFQAELPRVINGIIVSSMKDEIVNVLKG